MAPNEVAAAIHRRMAEDDRFGYSWGERWGAVPEAWDVLGRTVEVSVGDYDCSSSVITAWRLALAGTGYEGPLRDATYTGNMRAAFLATGLFEVWDTGSTTAALGDVYLNEGCHTAMCQDDGGWDALSEASINEFGEVYGGRRGDQTGREFHVRPFYDYPWDCTLHYVGGDLYGGAPPQPPAQPPAPSGGSRWQGDVVGREDTTGAGDDYAGVFGRPMLYVAVEGAGEYQAHDLGKPPGQWWGKVDRYDLSDEDRGMAGSGVPIDAFRITDPTVLYQTHNLGGGWNDVMRGTADTGGGPDDFAGEYGAAQDAVRIWREAGEQPRYNVLS